MLIGGRNLRRQRAGIADAGRAAEADDLEAELVERLLQFGGFEIILHHLAARRERGLHPGLRGQALGDGVARHQPRRDHHAGVGGVGAGGDRRDHDVALAEIEVLALDREARLGLLALLELRRHRAEEAGLGLAQQHAVLRPLRPGERGRDLAEVERQRVGEHRVRRRAGAQHALRLGVGLDEVDAGVLARGGLEIGDRLRVDREDAAGRAVFRRHVAERGAVGDRHFVEAGAVELDELADHALLAQHLRDGQHEVGRGDALAQRARQLEADHFGQQHRQRLAEHHRFRLDAADAPAEHGQAVDHGRVRIGADQRVGIGDFQSRRACPSWSRRSGRDIPG